MFSSTPNGDRNPEPYRVVFDGGAGIHHYDSAVAALRAHMGYSSAMLLYNIPDSLPATLVHISVLDSRQEQDGARHNHYGCGIQYAQCTHAGRVDILFLTGVSRVLALFAAIHRRTRHIRGRHGYKHRLRQNNPYLRKPGDTKHYIPRGGMFRYVSSANYLGEFIEWTGFAILTWSWSGAVFALWTFANLAPRANSIYKRYEQEFGREFKALKLKRMIPFIY